MKKKTPVSTIMSKEIISVQGSDTLRKANETLKSWHIRHVPVLSGKKIVGMLTQTDLQKMSLMNTVEDDEITKALFKEITVDQVMTRSVKMVKPNDSIHDVAVLLSTHDFHALPVCQGDDVVGIVTSTDLIKYLVDVYE